MTDTEDELRRRIAELEAEVERLRIVAKEYDHWRDDDSPKGENVPGVCY